MGAFHYRIGRVVELKLSPYDDDRVKGEYASEKKDNHWRIGDAFAFHIDAPECGGGHCLPIVDGIDGNFACHDIPCSADYGEHDKKIKDVESDGQYFILKTKDFESDGDVFGEHLKNDGDEIAWNVYRAQ